MDEWMDRLETGKPTTEQGNHVYLYVTYCMLIYIIGYIVGKKAQKTDATRILGSAKLSSILPLQELLQGL